MVKKLIVVGGWLTVAGMTLFDIFRKREDTDSIWSNAIQLMKDNFPFDKKDEKILEALIVAVMILGAPAFAVLKIVALVRMAMLAFC